MTSICIRSSIALVVPFVLALTAAHVDPAAAGDPPKKPKAQPEKAPVYDNHYLERRFGRPGPARSTDLGRSTASRTGAAPAADDAQIAAALAAAGAYHNGSARKLAEGSAVWHPIRGCTYSKYAVGSRSAETVSAQLTYVCDGFDKDTGRNFRTRVHWPVRLELEGGRWTLVRR